MHNFANRPYDGAQADVWSCGIVLFVLLFGRHPFLRPEDAALSDQQQMLALFTRTARESFTMLPAEAATISPECVDMLVRMLQTNPAMRCGGGGVWRGGGARPVLWGWGAPCRRVACVLAWCASSPQMHRRQRGTAFSPLGDAVAAKRTRERATH
jgi:hypothetical protein